MAMSPPRTPASALRQSQQVAPVQQGLAADAGIAQQAQQPAP
jgi:hypothetical protein